MNLAFWRKTAQPAKPEPRKIYVPDGKRRQILQALDVMQTTRSKLSRYDFWVLAEEICPETKEGRWEFDIYNAVNPYFIKISDK